MKINRKLLGSTLIVAILLSLISFPSLGMRTTAAPAVQDQPPKPPMTAPLVQDQTRDGELSKHIRKYDVVRMDPAAAVAQIKSRGRLVLKSSERDFDIQMTPNDIRSSDYTAHVIDSQGVRHALPRTEVTTYKGQVKGSPNAQVRMSLTDKGLEGAIISRERRLFIQPARAFSKEARPDDFVIYDAADLEKHEGTCGLELADEVAAQQEATEEKVQKVVDFAVSEPNQPLTTLKLARIATDADGEYVTAFGGASQANTQIQNILNFVDGIYQVEIGVTFQIVQQNTWADQNTDPYTTTNPGDLLTQFRNHWNANFASGGPNAPVRSLAHLFTGKEIDGTTIGIASFGVVCRTPTFAYGLSQRFPTVSNTITAQTVVLTAHEIGHNFAGSHTNQESDSVPGDLDRPCEGTIMEASVGTGASFCPFSRSQITGHSVAHSSCLTDLASTPPTSEDCTSTALTLGVTTPGSLSSGDCRSPSRGVEYFADRYTFNGTAGQRVAISMVNTSGLDPYVFLIAPDGYVLSQNDDVTDFETNSRIPTGPNTITLPQTGVYTVEATTFGRLQTGTYTITVQNPGCTLTATANVQHFGTAGGNGTISVTVSGPCSNNFDLDIEPGSASWITPTTTSGSGNVNINFSVANNPGSAGRRAFILVGTAPDGSGGIRIPITQSGSAPDCTTTPIAFGQTLNGNLANGDCHSPVRGNGFFADRYTFTAAAGQKVAVQTAAPVGNPDTFLTLLGPNGVVLYTDDDSGGGSTTNSRIPGGDKFVTLGLAGTYIIEVTGFDPSEVGSYTVTLTADGPPASTIQFSQASHSVNENAGSLNITVNRSGDTSGVSTVDYESSDTAGANQCSVNTGAASSRCDYLRTLGTLRFAAGETSKTIAIPIIDDVYVEGVETFTIALTNVNGATLGTSTATVSITSNDATTGTNPIDNATFFVREHYVDFLNREPDPAGLNFWVNEITSCGSNAPCIEVKRINVSAAFFISIEFQETGYLVYRTYKSAFGNLSGAPVPVVLNDFLRDTQQIGQGVQVNVGDWEAQLEANKQAYMLAFVQRADFLAAFPNSMTATAFVMQLNTRAGGVLSPGEQTALINTLGATPSDVTKRAEVLRAVAEDSDLRAAEFNKAFVLMQYFGYLRRNPNEFPDSNFDGFNFWLGKLNQFNGNFINAEMVKAFITSIEYRQRFGP